ncbi:MAG: hypothetical protein ACR2RV_15315 [Verrucomicrobiales bacterium]
MLGLTSIALAGGGFYFGAAHQKARELAFRETMSWYPATSFIDKFYSYMVDIEYEDDLHRSDFPLGAHFHIDRPDTKLLIQAWVGEIEAALTVRYGEGEWRVDGGAVTDGRTMADELALADFGSPSFEVGYGVSHNEGGRFCILVDQSERWVFFYSHFSD